LSRAYRPTPDERLIREFILQLKLGSIAPGYFKDKYRVDVRDRFREGLESLQAEGYLSACTTEKVALTREGLLRVDGLIKRFFLPEHVGIRYT
jgi:oxygen-independent coproporphyrinogen-3 oxidase